MANHVRTGLLSTSRHGRWLHVVTEDQMPEYAERIAQLHEEESRKRSESLKLYVASPAAQSHRERLRDAVVNFHARVRADLVSRGYVPGKLAEEVLYRSRTLHSLLAGPTARAR